MEAIIDMFIILDANVIFPLRVQYERHKKGIKTVVGIATGILTGCLLWHGVKYVCT